MFYRVLTVLLFIYFTACNGNNQADQDHGVPVNVVPEPVAIPYTVLNTFPHDTTSFTQGLEFFEGKLLESTGLEGRSSLREVDLRTGKSRQLRKLKYQYFGEGITVLGDTLYQLTWQNHLILLYDPKTLKPLGELNWSNEGWGITHDGQSLYISDGSDKIYQVHRGDLKLQRVISVSDHLGPLNNLNELEFIQGSIYANRLDYDVILKIDPSSGRVIGRMDLKDLLRQYAKTDITYLRENPNGAVLNGIAWNPANQRMYITGKLWPLLFELEMKP